MKEVNILCVEDGSVDLDSLEQEGLQDGKILVYRQGARPPFVLSFKFDDSQLKHEQNKVVLEKLEDTQSKLEYILYRKRNEVNVNDSRRNV